MIPFILRTADPSALYETLNVDNEVAVALNDLKGIYSLLFLGYVLGVLIQLLHVKRKDTNDVVETKTRSAGKEIGKSNFRRMSI